MAQWPQIIIIVRVLRSRRQTRAVRHRDRIRLRPAAAVVRTRHGDDFNGKDTARYVYPAAVVRFENDERPGFLFLKIFPPKRPC